MFSSYQDFCNYLSKFVAAHAALQGLPCQERAQMPGVVTDVLMTIVKHNLVPSASALIGEILLAQQPCGRMRGTFEEMMVQNESAGGEEVIEQNKVAVQPRRRVLAAGAGWIEVEHGAAHDDEVEGMPEVLCSKRGAGGEWIGGVLLRLRPITARGRSGLNGGGFFLSPRSWQPLVW